MLGQRRATVETTLRETQEENDEFRRRILGLEQQLKEARGLAEGGEAAEARLRDKVHRLEVSVLFTSWPPCSSTLKPPTLNPSHPPFPHSLPPPHPSMPLPSVLLPACTVPLSSPRLLCLGVFAGVNVPNFALVILSPFSQPLLVLYFDFFGYFL